MHVMTEPQALSVAQAIREARTLAAYVHMLNRSKRKPDDVLVKQSDRLLAALHAMDELKGQGMMYTKHAGTHYRSGLAS